MFLYLVVYDIPNNKRRQKVHDFLKGYGQRVQYSTFECLLPRAKFVELQERLQGRVDLEEDNIRFYPLSRHTLSQVQVWGVGPPVTEFPESVII
ncbi:MAG: CRISPR-associated endonuclease Cas2 [Phormidium sp. BM_Day4_Bin.17]|nr:CRISPR-associated endonuclease Cas2 [Phormidium sp. BM_Day4_Bin.17]UCJ11049.1 MAG: CRISPR-associated endonuclease Cas2 [Phormidium sp. PBR-2020]